MTIQDDPEIAINSIGHKPTAEGSTPFPVPSAPSVPNLPVSYATASPWASPSSDDLEIQVNVTPDAPIAAEAPPMTVAAATAIPATLRPGMSAYPGVNNIDNNDVQQQQINCSQQNTAACSSPSVPRKRVTCIAFVMIFAIIFIILQNNVLPNDDSFCCFDDEFFLNNNPTFSPAPSKSPVPTISPNPITKYTNYTLPPNSFAPTSASEATYNVSTSYGKV